MIERATRARLIVKSAEVKASKWTPNQWKVNQLNWLTHKWPFDETRQSGQVINGFNFNQLIDGCAINLLRNRSISWRINWITASTDYDWLIDWLAFFFRGLSGWIESPNPSNPFSSHGDESNSNYLGDEISRDEWPERKHGLISGVCLSPDETLR